MNGSKGSITGVPTLVDSNQIKQQETVEINKSDSSTMSRHYIYIALGRIGIILLIDLLNFFLDISLLVQ